MTQPTRNQKPLISNVTLQPQSIKAAQNCGKELPPLPHSSSNRGKKTRSYKPEPKPKPKVKLGSNTERTLQNSFPYPTSRRAPNCSSLHTTKPSTNAPANINIADNTNVNSESGKLQPRKRKHRSSRNYVRRLIRKKDEILEVRNSSRRRGDRIDKPLIESWVQETWDASHHFHPGSGWGSARGDYGSEGDWFDRLDGPVPNWPTSEFIDPKWTYLNSGREDFQGSEYTCPVIQECPGSPGTLCEYSGTAEGLFARSSCGYQSSPGDIFILNHHFDNLSLSRQILEVLGINDDHRRFSSNFPTEQEPLPFLGFLSSSEELSSMRDELQRQDLEHPEDPTECGCAAISAAGFTGCCAEKIWTDSSLASSLAELQDLQYGIDTLEFEGIRLPPTTTDLPKQESCTPSPTNQPSTLPPLMSTLKTFVPSEEKGISVIFNKAGEALKQYNEAWSNAQTSTRTPTLPFPSIAPDFSKSTLFRRHSYTPSGFLTKDLGKWNATCFYLHAFHLGDGSSHRFVPFDFKKIRVGEDKEKKKERLEGLRKQLKMEKVRWHEDKLRNVFGSDVCEDEVVKMVWGVVLELSEEVEGALEVLR